MRTIAIVTAGGTGTRMLNNIPKQFLTINEVPIIIYTLKSLQNVPDIDQIVIACLDEWIPILGAYVKEYGIDKVSNIVSGGSTGIESIKNCFTSLDEYGDDDVVLIHDGNRPLIKEDIIKENINAAVKYGAASTYTDIHDGVVLVDDNIKIVPSSLKRSEVKSTQTPHAFKFGVANKIFNEISNYEDYVSLADAAVKLGYKTELVKGSELNFKITTKNDLLILESIISTGRGGV